MKNRALGLYWRTAKYYLPSQLLNRIRLNFESFVTRRVPLLNKRRYTFPLREGPNPKAILHRMGDPTHEYDGAVLRECADQLERGEFKLLNQTQFLGHPVQWNAKHTTRLWRYNLHYFDYALPLGILANLTDEVRYGIVLKRLISDWIESNPVGHGVGWHSYPLSRRIVSWLQATSLASARLDWHGSEFWRTWTQSIYQQTRFLEDHLEFDISGNHLLANGKALVFAGIFWGNKDGTRWFKTGLSLLWSGLQEQILEDGGHYERSPMYQSIVLQDYLEVIHVLQLNLLQIPSWVVDRLTRMADFLFSILHPDCQIPLFADSAFGVAYLPSDILAAAAHLLGRPGRWSCARSGPFSCLVNAPSGVPTYLGEVHAEQSSLAATGYFILRNSEPDDKLIVDGKPMGPDHLPAHGHCSLFSYELSISGKRFIVDSGVNEYEAGPWRQFWRSTRAHNTLSVDGAEQSEIWSSFRVGDRSRLKGLSYSQQSASSHFVGMHSGFVGQKNPTPHRRFIFALQQRRWAFIDEIFGFGTHTIQSYIHLAPGVICEVDGQSALLRLNDCEMRLVPLFTDTNIGGKITRMNGQNDPVQGWYAPEFGKAFPNTVLEVSLHSTLPVRLGYLIAPAEQACESWRFDIDEHQNSANVTIAIDSNGGGSIECLELPQLPTFGQ